MSTYTIQMSNYEIQMNNYLIQIGSYTKLMQMRKRTTIAIFDMPYQNSRQFEILRGRRGYLQINLIHAQFPSFNVLKSHKKAILDIQL